MPALRGGLATVVVGTRAYVMGGLTEDSSMASGVSDFWSFEPDVGWTKLPDLLIARGNARATAVGATLYLIGGRSEESLSTDNQVLSYNLVTNGPWRSYPSMVQSRELLAVGAFDGVLYALGGAARPAGTTASSDLLQPSERAVARDTQRTPGSLSWR